MDADTQHGAVREGRRRPGSAGLRLAKLMTAELVFRELKKGAITLDTPFDVSEARLEDRVAAGRSMFARVNTSIRVEDLLRGLIVQSGNDAAIALAEGLGGSEENFAAMMNVRAAELGMTKSHFTDSWGGADPAQVVSARDMATLAEHLIKTYPELLSFLRREGVHLEQDPAAQPQSDPVHRRQCATASRSAT